MALVVFTNCYYHNVTDKKYIWQTIFKRATERTSKVPHAAVRSARAPVFLQRAYGRLLVAVRGAN